MVEWHINTTYTLDHLKYKWPTLSLNIAFKSFLC